MNMMWYGDDESLPIEVLVAIARGDEDAEELAEEPPHWRIGGKLTATSERETLTWSPVESRGYTDDDDE